jgi:5-deoxy-5-amino-3-dehydroquinate synthase
VITIPVELATRGYDVVVGPGAAKGLAGVVAERVPTAQQVAIVTQQPLAGQPWFAALDPGLPFALHTVPEGEVAKSTATVEALCRAFAASGLSRGDVVVAVGGGLVTDVAGFAAAVYHRGIPYCNVATTLLAQVDAAIGGKTGVNLPEGKNLVGAFWQPAAVLCDTDVLATLPPREWACGRGEIAKYALLGDPGLVAQPLEEQVAQCARMKAAVVAADEREGGTRAVLNYGHTLGHALEAASMGTGDLRHGEAVAVGLVFAAVLARRLGRIGDERVALHRQVVAALDLRADLPEGVDHERLLGFMARDKKAGHDLTFVLDGPDGVQPVHGVGPSDVLGALEELSCA